MIDPTRVRAFGPWVLVKVDRPPEKSKGGVYLPQGNYEERTGFRTGIAVSVGQGYFNKKSETGRIPKTKYTPLGISTGDRIHFRGMLHDVNKYHQQLDGLDHSMIHADDILGVTEE